MTLVLLPVACIALTTTTGDASAGPTRFGGSTSARTGGHIGIIATANGHGGRDELYSTAPGPAVLGAGDPGQGWQQTDTVCWDYQTTSKVYLSGGYGTFGWERGYHRAKGCLKVRFPKPGWFRFGAQGVHPDGTLARKLTNGAVASYSWHCPSDKVVGSIKVSDGEIHDRIVQSDPFAEDNRCTMKLVRVVTMLDSDGNRGPSQRYYTWQYEETFDFSSADLRPIPGYKRLLVVDKYMWMDGETWRISKKVIPAYTDQG
jgi:hypothetical protein